MPVEITLNVVVIEPGPARPDAICRMLSDSSGVSVRGVSTVKAVDALGRFDAIVIDLKRASQKGLDELDYLRGRLRSDAVIICVVGRNDTVLGSDAIRIHAQDCIIREDLSPEVLLTVVNSAVSRSRLQHGMRELIETNPDGMLVVCTEGRILFVNRACQKMMGHDESSLVGQEFGVPMVSRDTVEVQLGDGVHAEMRTVETQWAGRRALLVSLRDVTQRKLAEKEIWTRANFDELTKLPNRALFIDRLDNAIAASRRSNQSIGLMFVDLDRLKWVNDTYGHSAGDQVLRITAKRLQSCIRESDTVARLGGDEFVILLANINSPQGTERVARKVLDDIGRTYQLKDKIEISVSASIGIALCPENARDVYGLLNSADTAMYQAKAEGRNGYAFYSREMHDNALSYMSLEQDLRHAIENDELALYYQPVVDLGSGQIRNVEALLRWVHPTKGLLDTQTVIEIASHSRLLNHLDDWVLENSAQQARQWKGTLFSPPRIWINLASDRRKDAAFDEVLDETLANHGLTMADSSIGVEITQRCKIDESRETHELLNRIRSQGVQLAFDDFLDASSSINHLRNLPFDVVKIDRGAIRGITEREEDRGLVISLIEMAHRLNLKTVAEGVETHQQLNILREAGCDAGQGFLFSRALPAPEITEMLMNPRRVPTH